MESLTTNESEGKMNALEETLNCMRTIGETSKLSKKNNTRGKSFIDSYIDRALNNVKYRIENDIFLWTLTIIETQEDKYTSIVELRSVILNFESEKRSSGRIMHQLKIQWCSFFTIISCSSLARYWSKTKISPAHLFLLQWMNMIPIQKVINNWKRVNHSHKKILKYRLSSLINISMVVYGM